MLTKHSPNSHPPSSSSVESTLYFTYKIQPKASSKDDVHAPALNGSSARLPQHHALPFRALSHSAVF